MDVKRHEVIHHERGHRNFGKENTGQAEYLSKLALKRDYVVQQEQMRLAQALSRLGIQSSLNKDQSVRLRMNGSDTNNSLAPLARSSMMTTVEKFRHMRQQQQKQHHHLLLTGLLPVQGRQIFRRNLDTSGSRHVRDVNKNKMVDGGSGDFGSSNSSLSVLETEGITRRGAMKSKKTTKKLGNIAGDSLPQQYYQESNCNHLGKVRSKVKDTALPTVDSQPSHDHLSLVSSQTSLYYLPVMSHESGRSFWDSGVTALEGEYPDYSSAQTMRKTTYRKKHRFDRPVDDISPDDDKLDKLTQEQIHKEKMNKSRKMTRTPLILPSILEHQSLEIVCSKCIALEKKQQSNRLISKSTSDIPEKTSIFSQTNRNSNNKNSRDLHQAVRQPPVEFEQSTKKRLKKSNVRYIEDEYDEDNQDLIVTSLPAISQSQIFTEHFRRGNIKRLNGSEHPRNGLKLHANFVDNVDRSLEISNLDPCLETYRVGPRKINIVIDMPDMQISSTTPDIEREISATTPDFERQQ